MTGRSNKHGKMNDSELLYVQKLSAYATLPSRGSEQSAGYDLSSARDGVVPAHGKRVVETDISIRVPEGTYGRIAPRSGLASRHFIDVGAGVIDRDYRGNVGVILFNHSDDDFTFRVGDRIAQLVLEKIDTPEVMDVDGLDVTPRGEQGFGSSGVQ
jgi:dUTP pyrophosphatase